MLGLAEINMIANALHCAFSHDSIDGATRDEVIALAIEFLRAEMCNEFDARHDAQAQKMRCAPYSPSRKAPTSPANAPSFAFAGLSSFHRHFLPVRAPGPGYAILSGHSPFGFRGGTDFWRIRSARGFRFGSHVVKTFPYPLRVSSETYTSPTRRKLPVRTHVVIRAGSGVGTVPG